MSELKNQNRYVGLDRRTPRPGATAPKTTGTPAAPEVYKTGGRHSAITNSLYNFHSYKNWAEKARGNFDEKK